jgi:hypothetical protein
MPLVNSRITFKTLVSSIDASSLFFGSSIRDNFLDTCALGSRHLVAEVASLHIAAEAGRRIMAVTVERTIRVVQPQAVAAAALQRVAVSIVKRVGKLDVARVLALVVDSVPAARVIAINPHD